MNVQEAKLYLRQKYPDKEIIVQRTKGKVAKLIVDIDPSEDHPGWSRVISVIFDSEPHKHFKTTEIYVVEKGTLLLHVGNKEILLQEGDAYGILPEKVHWGESADKGGVVIMCYMVPGWSKDDYLIVS